MGAWACVTGHHAALHHPDRGRRHRGRDEPSSTCATAAHGRGSGAAVPPGEPRCAVRPEDAVTTTTITRTSTRAWQVSAEAKALLERFPPRLVPASWPQTRQDRAAVEARVAEAPFRANVSHTRSPRKLSVQAVLD